MEVLAQANSLLIEEHYSEAISLYRSIKETTSEAAANLILALLRSGNLEEAVQEGELGHSNLPEDHLITLRLAQALFQSDKFEAARELFRLVPEQPLSASYLKKCDKELSRPPPTHGRYTWFQTDSHIVLEFPVKVASKEQCIVTPDELQLDVKACTTTNEEYHLVLNLLQAINPYGTDVKVTPSHLEVTLEKKNKVNWIAVEPEAIAQAASYPTSSSKKHDWSKVGHEIDQELKKEKPEGDEALMTLFRQIYENGDENQRKAMMKSFQTSAGTVLSTNWGEVAEKDYEGKDRPAPPEGQTWAK